MIQPLPSFDDDVWELYDTTTDWSQSHDLAAEMPEQLAELQELWLAEARKYNVLPLDDRRVERFNSRPGRSSRPDQGEHADPLRRDGATHRGVSLLNIKNRSHAVTAEVEVPEGGAQGVVIAQGGAFAGWSLYLHDGRPRCCYNLLDLRRFVIDGDTPVPSGTHQLRMEFAFDGGGLGKGGAVRLYLDGAQVGEGRVDATVPTVFSADETADVGRDYRLPGQHRLRGRGKRVHRQGQLGADRPR